jgi:hypothetical protein
VNEGGGGWGEDEIHIYNCVLTWLKCGGLVWAANTLVVVGIFTRYLHSPQTGIVNKLKGTVSREGYFFEGLNILIGTLTFCVCADGFQGLLKAFHYPVQLLTFYCLCEITY